jgi:hypothetical protein
MVDACVGDNMRELLFNWLNKLVWWLAKRVADLGGWKYAHIVYSDDEKWFP